MSKKWNNCHFALGYWVATATTNEGYYESLIKFHLITFTYILFFLKNNFLKIRYKHIKCLKITFLNDIFLIYF